MEFIGTIAALGGLWDKVSSREDFSTILKNLGVSSSDIKLMAAGGSMTAMVKNHIIEPTIIVTKESNSRKDINKVLEASVDVYASWMVLIFKILVSLEKLSPGQALSVLANKGFDYENYAPKPDGLDRLDGLSKLPNLDMESIGIVRSVSSKEEQSNVRSIIRQLEVSINVTTNEVVKSAVTKETSKETTKYKGSESEYNDFPESDEIEESYDRTSDRTRTNELKQVNNVLVIPIIIKANVHVVDFEEIANAVSIRDKGKTLHSRLLQKKLDLITTRQFWFGGDIVEEYKRGQLAKKDIASELNKKARSVFKLNDMIDRKSGLGKMVVTYIMGDEELERLCAASGFNIDKKSEKDQLMNALMAFNVTSIDDVREAVSVYIHAITGYSVSKISSLSKNNNSSDGIELLAKAMMANKPF